MLDDDDDDDDDDDNISISFPGPNSIMINSGSSQISRNQQISPHLQAAAAWYVVEASQTMGVGWEIQTRYDHQ